VGGNAVSPSGEAQQASATRATMTTVAVMSSMAISRLDSPSPLRWLKKMFYLRHCVILLA